MLSSNQRGQSDQPAISYDLQLNLLNTWTKFKVADYYQNIFLAYLDQLPKHELETRIKAQIKNTLQRKSPYFQLQRLDKQRKILLSSLNQKLSVSQSTLSQQQLIPICSDLQQLRQANLISGQLILRMRQMFNCQSVQSSDKQMDYYGIMLQNLDKDCQLLRESILNKYISFDQGYDPFFMHHYQQFHRNKHQYSSEAVKKLFNINISFAYRLIKTKNSILELRAQANADENELQQDEEYFDRLQFNQSENVSMVRPVKAQLVKQIPVYNEEDNWQVPRNIKQSRVQRIQPIQIYPSENKKYRTTIYPTEYRNRPNSSSRTEAQISSKLKFSKIVNELDAHYPAIDTPKQNRPNYRKTEPDQSKDYQYPNRDIAKRPEFNYQEERGKSLQQKSDRYKTQMNQNYRPMRLTPLKLQKDHQKIMSEQNVSNYLQNRISKRISHQDLGNQRGRSIERKERVAYQPIVDGIRHYNPIKGEQYGRKKQLPKIIKYDFNPQFKSNAQDYSIRQNNRDQQQDDKTGLVSQLPITKYNIKPKHLAKKSLVSQPQQNESKQQQFKQAASREPIKQLNNNLSKNNKAQSKQVGQMANGNPRKTVAKIDQECQTIQLKKTKAQQQHQKNDKSILPKEQKIKAMQKQAPKIQMQDQNENEQQNEQQSQGQNYQKQTIERTKLPAIKKKNQDQDMTLQDEDIIDERPNKVPAKKKQLIRTLDKAEPSKPVTNSTSNKPVTNSTSNKPVANPTNSKSVTNSINKEPSTKQKAPVIQSSSKANPSTRKNQTVISSVQNDQNGQKKQIRMKIGKSTITQFLSTLQKVKINEKYKVFQLQKLIQWIKVSQTYLTQFHVNDQLAIIALCSPIPGVGMALKLWAPVNEAIDQNISNNIFKKYLQFVEKSTTIDKIMYSGTEFPQLLGAQFTAKKQKLYERIRKSNKKQDNSQFKPFLYLQCSNVKFTQNGNQKLLYSQEIEQFSQDNYFAAKFVAEVSKPSENIQSLVKINQKTKDFTAVNTILTKQQFDNYQASQVNSNNIDLLRFYLNSTIKSTFLAHEGFIRFSGLLLYQKNNESLVSVPISRSNGMLYFSKGLSIAAMLQKIKISSTSRISFSVKMFSKKLYGKMIGFGNGCYGNWEINLTWEDEMQGRIRHNLTQGYTFGPEPFLMGVEIQKQMLYCARIGKDDFIF